MAGAATHLRPRARSSSVVSGRRTRHPPAVPTLSVAPGCARSGGCRDAAHGDGPVDIVDPRRQGNRYSWLVRTELSAGCHGGAVLESGVMGADGASNIRDGPSSS